MASDRYAQLVEVASGGTLRIKDGHKSAGKLRCCAGKWVVAQVRHPSPSTGAEPSRNLAPGQGRSSSWALHLDRGPEPGSTGVRPTVTGWRTGTLALCRVKQPWAPSKLPRRRTPLRARHSPCTGKSSERKTESLMWAAATLSTANSWTDIGIFWATLASAAAALLAAVGSTVVTHRITSRKRRLIYGGIVVPLLHQETPDSAKGDLEG